jgi:hypothetical protein
MKAHWFRCGGGFARLAPASLRALKGSKMRSKCVLFLCVAMLVTIIAESADAQLFQRLRARRAQAASCSGGLVAQPTVQVSSCSGGLVAQQYAQPVQQFQPIRRIINRVLPAQTPTLAPVLPPMPVQECVDGTCTMPQASVEPSVRQEPTTPQTAPIAPIAPIERVASPVLFGLNDLSSTQIPDHILAQVDEPKATARDSFRKNLVKAIEQARKDKKITIREAARLRVATISPAFVERAHDLAVVQIAFSNETSDSVPVNEEGVIQVEGIDWDGLIKFLEAFIPLLLTLLKAFGMA